MSAKTSRPDTEPFAAVAFSRRHLPCRDTARSTTMMLGILIMLVASAAYNSAPIALRAATRALPERSASALLRAVLTSRLGVLGLALSLGGWGLEVVALTLLPLTLARSLLAAGLILMLALAWRELHEAVRWQGILGVLTIV